MKKTTITVQMVTDVVTLLDTTQKSQDKIAKMVKLSPASIQRIAGGVHRLQVQKLAPVPTNLHREVKRAKQRKRRFAIESIVPAPATSAPMPETPATTIPFIINGVKVEVDVEKAVKIRTMILGF